MADVFGMEPKAFFQKFELRPSEAGGTLVHQCGTFVTENRTVLAVDLDFFSTEVKHLVQADQVGASLDQVHDVIKNAFVKSLSDQLYERLHRGDA